MTSSGLDMFMGLKGINPNFTDAWGKDSTVSDESLRTLITSMGFNSHDDAQLIEHYHEKEKQFWLSPLSPVSVSQKDSDFTFEIRLPIDLAAEELLFEVTLEDKKKLTQSLAATSSPLTAINEFSDTEFHCYQITLDMQLPLGYHLLSVYESGIEEALATMSVIITPSRCYSPDSIVQGKKIWGPSVQLYCIKSENNWGIGDFSDLKNLLLKTNEYGGDFIGLNPIHALSPSQPKNASPYSPTSRKWLNILYIDITAVEEFAGNKDLQEKVNSEAFKQQLNALRDTQWVDYEAVAALKISSLRKLFATLNDGSVKSKKRLVLFNRYVEEKGESLKQQASYDALQFHFFTSDNALSGWPEWPGSYQSYAAESVQNWIQDNAEEVLFWSYTQWVAELQLQEADQLAKSLRMTLGIYRDLAVGVKLDSSEVWANRSLYCEKISIGAPPDVLGPLGQSWGLPPIEPSQLQETAYQPFIELLQSNMSYCGALRIDHVMALLRLWWVPDNATADKGAYIYYPVDDMLNLLALESVRNQCLVIGEDLGTIPDGMDVLLKEAGVYSYKVFFFEQAEDGGYIAPQHYAKQAMATLSTHDIATIKGFWHCEDLYLGRELGLYPDAESFDKLLVDRVYCKQQILDSLHGMASVPADFSRDALYTEMDQTLNFALQKHLAKGSSALLSLQLEDFLEMDQPVNVPGTCDEYRNWQRKLTKTLEEIFHNPAIQQLCSDLTTARKNAGSR